MVYASQELCPMELLYKNMYTYRPGKQNNVTLSRWVQDCTQVFAA
jgi:hypothetical protein